MALITSISGIRGTIGGKPGENLTPYETVKFTAAYITWLKQATNNPQPKIVLGRDARISGKTIENLVTGTLLSLGAHIINIGLATTPTTEIAVMQEKADGGIIITASHNPKQWNALKFLNSNGEFLESGAVREVLKLYENADNITFNGVETLGEIIATVDYTQKHIDLIKSLELVDVEAIKKAWFTVAVDCINSVGAIAVPMLLKELGVKQIYEINCIPNGDFAHNPEPLEQNLTELMHTVKERKADVGFAVDPDVDRLAIVSEDGTYFGEEYTLVAVADYVLRHKPGNTVSNLSSSRALKDITEKYGGKYYAAAVGEINVVMKMKETGAVIGGEGNGGVIYPELHYGRDALVGIALFLSYMAKTGLKPSQIRAQLPDYIMTKTKYPLENLDFDTIKQKIIADFKDKAQITTIDGVKLDFPEGWVHLRKSNTEPIVRLYAESQTNEQLQNLINLISQYFA